MLPLAAVYILVHTPYGWAPCRAKSRVLCNVDPREVPGHAVLKRRAS